MIFFKNYIIVGIKENFKKVTAFQFKEVSKIYRNTNPSKVVHFYNIPTMKFISRNSRIRLIQVIIETHPFHSYSTIGSTIRDGQRAHLHTYRLVYNKREMRSRKPGEVQLSRKGFTNRQIGL